MPMVKMIAVLLGGCLIAAQSMAMDGHDMEKVKTGILPAGGFYSIYEVQCRSEEGASIAAMSRRAGPWCVQDAGELVCFRRSADALRQACAGIELAANDASSESMQGMQ